MKINLSNQKYLMIFFSILINSITSQNPIIVIPFKINRIPNTKSSEFDTSSFIQEYYIRDFYTSLATGIPSKKILAVIDTQSHIFHFGKNYLSKNSLNEIYDPEKIISKEIYDRTKSLSFKNISRFHYTNIELKTASLCSEIFLLYTDVLMEKGQSISDIQFIIDDDMQNDLHIRLGLGKPLTVEYGGPPHFIQSLLNVKAIKDQSWTIKFKSKNDGVFILGEEPHKYEDISLDKRYQRKNYFSTNSASSVEYRNPISIIAQDVYLEDEKGEEISINKDKGCYLNYNKGFVKSTKEYWDYIKKNFFNKFLVSNICKEEVIKFTTEEDAVKSYFVISCDKVKLFEEDKEILDKFPTLKFFIFDFNYNFELTKDDVFTEVNNVLYFMIIYQRDIFNNPELVYWDLGLPFMQKYQFVHNYEKKTVGFYIPEKEEEEESKEDNEKEKEIEKEKEKSDVNKNTDKKAEEKVKDDQSNLIIYIFIGIILAIGLLIGAFCLGKYMYQNRKKKANELEENFDYTASNNKNKEKEDEGIIN
jgi:hypothetical protein